MSEEDMFFLPNEIWKYCIFQYLVPYTPFICEVCHKWKQMIEDLNMPVASDKCVQNFPTSIELLDLVDLATLGHTALLEWIIPARKYYIRAEIIIAMMEGAARTGHETTLRYLNGTCLDIKYLNDNAASLQTDHVYIHQNDWNHSAVSEYTNIAKTTTKAVTRSSVAESVYRIQLAAYNRAMASAAAGGNENIVCLCRQWGANNFGPAMEQAAKEGNLNLLRLLMKWAPHQVNESEIIIEAACGGQTHIIEYLDIYKPREQSINTNDIMRYAAFHGHASLVLKCYNEWGATDVNDAMCHAAFNGYSAIVLLCKKLGATYFDQGIVYAASNGHADIVKKFIDWGATYIPAACKEAIAHEHWNIVDLFVKKGFDVPDVQPTQTPTPMVQNHRRTRMMFQRNNHWYDYCCKRISTIRRATGTHNMVYTNVGDRTPRVVFVGK